jgi:MFS transporter, DHA1 family, multidrug resistance protein
MAGSGIFVNGAPKPMVIGIAISALIAFVIAWVTLPTENGRLPAAAPEEI